MEKKCEWCGELFTPKRKDSKYCSAQHYTNCKFCEVSIEIKQMKRIPTYCSGACSSKDHKDERNFDCICQLCGNGFRGSKSTDKFCTKPHMEQCVVCGTEFEIISPHRPAKTCSKKCAMATADLATRKTKTEESTLKKYGVKNISQLESVKAKKRKTTFTNYGVENIFQTPENQEKLAKVTGVRISKKNRAMQAKLLEELGVEFEFEALISGSSYADLGFNNILIEINPTETHNSTIAYTHLVKKCTKENCQRHLPKSETYHQERALAAEKNGKILLQYFDWMNPLIFISIVRSKLKMCENKISARKTTLKEISQRDANTFLRENHLSGASNGQTLCLGLYSGEELVHVQTYGPARMNKNYEWEAIRSCTKNNYQIQGAYSKCDKYFFNKVDPKSVISYVDLAISAGNTEANVGGWTILKTNRPSATWVNLLERGEDKPLFVKDSAARRASADRILGFEVGEKYPRFGENGEKITNDFVLLSEGYVKVFDAGTRTFVWEKG